jgi:hypothetical protein
MKMDKFKFYNDPGHGWLRVPKKLLKELGERKLENEKKADSNWLGVAGDKIEVSVTIIKAITLEGTYGCTTLYIMRDDAGNKVTWNSSSYSKGESGDKLRLKGTIKKVDMYNGEKQTVLTRCKVIA